MIDCTENYIYKKKNHVKTKRRFFLFMGILLSFAICYFYSKYFISGQIINICKDYSYSYATQAVNKAVIETLKDKISYSDLINLEKDANGDITLISTNSYKINEIDRKIVEKTSMILSDKIAKGIPIPLFAFTGIKLFAGYGKTVNFKSISVSSVSCDFLSEFNSRGINQTLHSIYLEVISVIDIEFPLNSQKVEYRNKILITEAVLVGKVPNVYLNGHIF